MTSAGSVVARLRAGGTVACGWCTLGSPAAADLVARAGFPAVAIDQQHGLFSWSGTADAIAAIRAAGAAPVVRVPLADLAAVSRVLDLGADVVIMPMVNSASDAAAFVAAAKYPPAGERSWGPVRALPFSGLAPAEYLAGSGEATLALAMIETAAALASVDAILATPGLDGVFVGPSDLSVALSRGTLDPYSAAVTTACETVVAAAARAGKLAGAYGPTPERAREFAHLGFTLVATSSDAAFIADAATAAAHTLR